MANNATPKLKAYVQTDATGRVVSGTPVFRSSKPKIGNWKEIPTYYRGDGNTTTSTTTIASSTTTTTTTLAGTTTTTTTGGGPNIISAVGAFSQFNACSGTGNGLILYYSGMLGNGTALYNDSGLTSPYNPGSFPSGNGNYLYMYFQADNQVCTMSGNVIQSFTSCSSITTTTTTTTQALTLYNADYQNGGVGDPCLGTGQFNLPLVVNLGLNPCGGASVTLASGTWASYGVSTGLNLRVNFGAQGTPGTFLTINPGGTNTSTNFGCTACENTTTTTTTASIYKPFALSSSVSGDSGTACLNNTYPLTWYFTGSGTYPTVGDTIYSSPGTIYQLFNNWIKLDNGHALQGDSSGVIIQDVVCSTTTTTTTATIATTGAFIADLYLLDNCNTPAISNSNINSQVTPIKVGKWYTAPGNPAYAFYIVSKGGTGVDFYDEFTNERDSCLP